MHHHLVSEKGQRGGHPFFWTLWSPPDSLPDTFRYPFFIGVRLLWIDMAQNIFCPWTCVPSCRVWSLHVLFPIACYGVTNEIPPLRNPPIPPFV